MGCGGVAEHYARQKSNCVARFKIDLKDVEKIGRSQFTIFDFITNLFAFSPRNKQLSIILFEQLAQEPKSFSTLVAALNARKSTVFLLCLSLERSGFMRKRADRKYELSPAFSTSAREYAVWWENWVSRNSKTGNQAA